MKIIVTGSLGNVSKPLAETLVQKGHEVTVISSKKEKQKDIEAIGATAAIGKLEDVDFLLATFAGADAVYTMVPPANYFDQKFDLLDHYFTIGSNYKEAIKQSGIKRVVNLSSFGAHLQERAGILAGSRSVEKLLNELPADTIITHIRPTSFYTNMYGYVEMIKNTGFIAANYGADKIIPWVSPEDIAAAITEEFSITHIGRKVRYVASEELTGYETAKVLGDAIGKPDLQWILIEDEQVQTRLKAAGMNPKVADDLVEMFSSFYKGLVTEDYYRNKPSVMGKVKLVDFAKQFAESFKQSRIETV
jgi:uncharacterized protein YbjT (DUF2867 family)